MILDVSGMLCGCEVELITETTINGKPVWRITNICNIHDQLFKESKE